MPLNVKAGGSWRTASKVYAKVSGAWVTAKELWGYVSGGWRSAWKNEIRYINTSNRTAASIFELMGSPTQPGTYIFENQATISAGTGSFALRTGVFPAGSTLTIVNKGYIRGKGGAGGPYNGAGSPGGAALYLDMSCSLDNGDGFIFGGGGGGGGSFGYNARNSYSYAPGGGGAGVDGGAAGSGYGYDTNGRRNATPPTAGTADAGGKGAAIEFFLQDKYSYRSGGDGGGPGVAGAAGTKVAVGLNKSSEGVYSGGAAGAAISLNGNTVSITAGNDTTRIKGAVA